MISISLGSSRSNSLFFRAHDTSWIISTRSSSERLSRIMDRSGSLNFSRVSSMIVLGNSEMTLANLFAPDLLMNNFFCSSLRFWKISARSAWCVWLIILRKALLS